MASSISGARLALYDLLAASPPTSSTQPSQLVQVTFGDPAAYTEQEVIALLGVDDADEEPGPMGAQRRNETFILQVGIKTHDPAASTAQAVDARWYALYDYLRDVVKANTTFAPNTVYPAEVIGITSIPPYPKYAVPAEGGGWLAVMAARVQCKARIT